MNDMPGMAGAAPVTMIVMMVAMMLPIALAQSARRGVAFGMGYVFVWAAFGAAAALVQAALDRAGLLSGTMALRSVPLAALVVAGVGLYQLTPLKRRCLARCAALPDAANGVLSGLRYGVGCVGCCWALMALVFVTGMMNVVALGAIAAFVAMERWLPLRAGIAQHAGIALIACGAVLPLAR